jgi:hypothetical protein
MEFFFILCHVSLIIRDLQHLEQIYHLETEAEAFNLLKSIRKKMSSEPVFFLCYNVYEYQLCSGYSIAQSVSAYQKFSDYILLVFIKSNKKLKKRRQM